MFNRLVLIGNGFDLAHGLKTSYNHFVEWYLRDCALKFINQKVYSDELIEIKYKFNSYCHSILTNPINLNETMRVLNNDYNVTTFKSNFFKDLVDTFLEGTWVNIECRYFHKLKTIFENRNISKDSKHKLTKDLNREFRYLIEKLSEYFELVNHDLTVTKSLPSNSRSNMHSAFTIDDNNPVKFVNFNYTDTLKILDYAYPSEIIHIHGQVSDSNNPIIFGYGDESDPMYQRIEDCGDNVFLEHMKSFGYLKTNNYAKLMSEMDDRPFKAYVVGHSCGMSDRILLNQIFEHPKCMQIEIFYHKRKDGSDNFEEITHEISRHFKSQNKDLFRRRVKGKNSNNYIPQNILEKASVLNP